MLVTKLLSVDRSNAEIQFDLGNHVGEILEGVNEANKRYRGALEVCEIQVVPDDFPTKGQARFSAFQIAEHVLTNDV